ncbi:hypothetical protein FW778_22440 [Ginsengibacter hankyongi]|uniref:Beta-propeller repeat-containing protein n=1 Tax=Ginsengibacter hankyongi TaxID=2607284 RepID=A0A5J5IAN5_9BACT|nr:hypothetical protein [Ginsengibacter hankyongi]KAA9034442.1 hypothetical protein FW778_22440 [Ginsengibacter hankyongi]
MLPKNIPLKLAVALCLMSAAIPLSCKKNGSNKTIPGSSHNVYIAGYTISQTGSYTATYWKNDSPVNLPNSQGSGAYPQANAIFTNGSDIYVAGSNRGNGLFWKNQALQPILNAVNLNPKSIFITGGDVYVAGDSVHDYPSNLNSYGTFWKNNVPVYLPTCNLSTGITVSGNDVYISGSGAGKAAYWKNGNPVYLTALGANTGYAFGIAVSGQDVYVTGDTATSYTGLESVYWKNGIAMHLENGIHASGIAIAENGDVYVSGQSTVNFNSRATYWKNGKSIILSNAPSDAKAIALSGEDVYVVGDTVAPFQIPTAVYWKNGVMKALTQGTVSSSATSIFIEN